MDKEITILFIDDEMDFAQSMAFWFKSKGYKTLVGNQGKEGLKIIQEISPDIVFLDMRMPEENGIGVLKKIRQINKDIPVIIISAYVEPSEIKEAESLGISGVFYKDKEFEEGLALLEFALHTHKKIKNKMGK